MAAESAAQSYTARVQIEARESDTLRQAGRQARPAIDRIITTETATAFNDGIVEEGKTIAAEYDIELEKVWVAEGDACSICAALDGTTLDLHEEFEGGGPGSVHPNCRCVVQLKRKES